MQRRHRIIFSVRDRALRSSRAANKKEVESAKQLALRHRLRDRVQRGARGHARAVPEPQRQPGAGQITTAWHQVPYANNAGRPVEHSAPSRRARRARRRWRGLARRRGRRHADAPRVQALLHPVRRAGRRRAAVARQGRRPRGRVGARQRDADRAARHGAAAVARRPHRGAAGRDLRKHQAVRDADEGRGARSPRRPTRCRRPIRRRSRTSRRRPRRRSRCSRTRSPNRDYPTLRELLADDVVWSLGGGTGADAAMAMWQADPEALDAMARRDRERAARPCREAGGVSGGRAGRQRTS